MRRRGRPGLLGVAARTAVVAGTATAVSGSVRNKQEAKQEAAQQGQQQEQGDARPRGGGVHESSLSADIGLV